MVTLKPNTNIRQKKERRKFSLKRETKENYAKIFCGQWHGLEVCAEYCFSIAVAVAALPYHSCSWWFVYRSDVLVFKVVHSRSMQCYAYYFLPRGETRLHEWIIFLVPLNRIGFAEQSIISKRCSFLHSFYFASSSISLSPHHILNNFFLSSFFFVRARREHFRLYSLSVSLMWRNAQSDDDSTHLVILRIFPSQWVAPWNQICTLNILSCFFVYSCTFFIITLSQKSSLPTLLSLVRISIHSNIKFTIMVILHSARDLSQFFIRF